MYFIFPNHYAWELKLLFQSVYRNLLKLPGLFHPNPGHLASGVEILPCHEPWPVIQISQLYENLKFHNSFKILNFVRNVYGRAPTPSIECGGIEDLCFYMSIHVQNTYISFGYVKHRLLNWR